jgi:hypothetical protein
LRKLTSWKQNHLSEGAGKRHGVAPAAAGKMQMALLRYTFVSRLLYSAGRGFKESL